MNPRTVAPVVADLADIDSLAGLIADAFAPLPPSRWLVDDNPRAWARIAPRYFALYLEHAVTGAGIVHTTADRDAVAVWFDKTLSPPTAPADYHYRLAEATGAYVDRFRRFDVLLDAHQPHLGHHHLAFLAVRPDRQNQGLGTALIAHHHRYLDEHSVGAYLDAGSPDSYRLYLRHGYAPYGEPITLPGPQRTQLWPMWRQPGACKGTLLSPGAV